MVPKVFSPPSGCSIAVLKSLILFLKRLACGQRLFLLLGPLLVITNTAFASGKLRHVYLTWQRDPCHTMTVNIHGLGSPSSLTIYYDKKPHFGKLADYAGKCAVQGKRPLSLPDRRFIYQGELTQLEPGTTYYCMVGDQTKSYGKEFHFCTPKEDGPWVFVEGGDWDNTKDATALAKVAASLNPAAFLLGGDYTSGALTLLDYKEWDIWLDMYTHTMLTDEGHLIPMVMAIGNHEVVGGYAKTKQQVPFFFHYFKQGEESYFSLAFGKRLKLFVLDTGHAASIEGQQTKWLQKELEISQEFPIKFAMYHVPLYPSIHFAEKDLSYYTCYGLVKWLMNKQTAERLFSQESFDGRKHWLPLFDRFGLTAAFEHHDQTLKRTKFLKDGTENVEGTLYLGDGGWDSTIQFPPIQGYFHSYFAMLLGKEHFFWVIKVEKNKIIYQAMTVSGKVIDQCIQTN